MRTSVGAYPGIDDNSTRRSALPSVCPYPRSNGSITTLAWNGDMLCTSMMRGFNKALLCMRNLGKRSMETSAACRPGGTADARPVYLLYSSTTRLSLMSWPNSERSGAPLNVPCIFFGST